MTRCLRFIVFFVCIGVLHCVALNRAAAARKTLPVNQASAYVIPAPFLKVVTLEFKGVVSDILLLKSLVFFGSTMERGESTFTLKDWEWDWLFKLLKTSSSLDPYFLDPYYFGGNILTNKPTLVEELNLYLEEGANYRTWDWFLPFLIGWHRFYYFHDNEGAARYLQEAYKRNQDSSLLATLAARLSYQAKRTENAIIFLEEILSKTDDPEVRKIYELRLQALIAIDILEKATSKYYQTFGVYPERTQDLLKANILKRLPSDPYGGEFIIQKGGSVITTSNLIPTK